MPLTLISLVGEQPIPNLLPIRYLHKQRDDISSLVMVYTKTTKPRCELLSKLLSGANIIPVEVDGYNIGSISAKIRKSIDARNELLFNLTGGTKPMTLAAYTLAQQTNSRFIYLQSENKESSLFTYEFKDGQAQQTAKEVIPEVIDIHDYLCAYIAAYEEDGFSRDKHGQLNSGGEFEQAIYNALRSGVAEIKAGIRPVSLKDQLEIDLVVRCGNQVGIIEAKTGGSSKKAIDQLTTAADQRYLGTYTAKFWVAAGKIRYDLRALALAHRITMIELPQYVVGHSLYKAEADKLRQTVRKGLGA